jgi:hypothetical protein
LTEVVQRRLADVAIPAVDRMASEEAVRDALIAEPNRGPLGPYLSTAPVLDIVRRLGPADEAPRLKRRLTRSQPPRKAPFESPA